MTVVRSNFAPIQNDAYQTCEAWPLAPLEPASYGLIVADPPWRFRTWSETNQEKSASRHYGLMQIEDIKALPVGELAQRDCVLLLWITAPMLQEGLEAAGAWGFRYKSNMVWRKVTPRGKVRQGTGYWARSMHEQVLICTRGKPQKYSAFPSVFDGIVREHSRKPEEFYRLVEQRTAGLRRADVFARQGRPGWEAFGNEASKFDASPENEPAATVSRPDADPLDELPLFAAEGAQCH